MSDLTPLEDLKSKDEQRRALRDRVLGELNHSTYHFRPGQIIVRTKAKARKQLARSAVDGKTWAVSHKWSLLGVASLLGLFFARKPLLKAWQENPPETWHLGTRLKTLAEKAKTAAKATGTVVQDALRRIP